ncbi:sensor histidine kinase [Actinomadura atramentaria]|uniref:sensor histidine kinase n=1 Tax=Actinomadura atramentaria TaxID=1990 RepID=UPI0003A3002E|nr:histidine kinase [Actinomadura atramentaria]
MNERAGGLDRVHSVGGCLLRVAVWGCSALVLLASVLAGGRTPLNLALCGVAALAVVGALVRRDVLAWAGGVAAVSGAATVAVLTLRPVPANPAVALEIAGLLVLVVRTVHKAPRDRLVVLTALTSGSVLLLGARFARPVLVVVTVPPLAVLVAVAIGVGFYLRALDERRVRALAAARRDERLELARDLHDFVAHHVTGIVVQAQAARFAAGSGAAQSPEQLDAMLASIEKAGGEALTSMRRMVGLLRDARGGAADPADGLRPVGGLAQVAELVGDWTEPPASLAVAPDVGEPPPEVATTLHRIVQEALTNVRKHAADATAVRVEIRRRGGDVEVVVTDDGQGRGRRLPSGGFGLAGLDERVAALGGRLRAGPGPRGGWRVAAVLPAAPALRESRA